MAVSNLSPRGGERAGVVRLSDVSRRAPFPGGSLRLPEGLPGEVWEAERRKHQNPRIRSLLRAIEMLEEVRESGVALLHFSPGRVQEVAAAARGVRDLLLSDLAPHLEAPSPIPALDEARARARRELQRLTTRLAHQIPTGTEGRRAAPSHRARYLLSRGLGQLHGFVQETFGSLMAADPRSQHEADYYLSRRFPEEVREARSLCDAVVELNRYLRGRGRVPTRGLGFAAATMQRQGTLPSTGDWRRLQLVLEEIRHGLAPRLKALLHLPGIRFLEMKLLDRYATELPSQCDRAIELYGTARQAIDRMEGRTEEALGARVRSARLLTSCQLTFSRRIARALLQIERSFAELYDYTPVWLDNIQRRRALGFDGR